MNEPLSTDPYKGVRDFYPKDWARLQALFARARTTLLSWGYEEYNASPLERAELYEAKTSEEIVNEQTYTFTDRGDRGVTLRPEMTPTLARMVAGRRRELPHPLRWFSIGNRFRYERPQKGRLREFYQVDIDMVGLPEGEADIEIITLVNALVKSFGASEKDFVIRMNSRRLLNAACAASGLTGEEVKQYLRLLDKRGKMTPDAFADASRTITAKDPLALIADTNAPEEIASEVTKLNQRISALKERGVSNVVFDAGITRGFDYYTGMVFEVFDTNPANPRSMFGGGRYDGLVALFGGDPIPAVGFAFGDVVFADFLEAHSLALPTDAEAQIYVGSPSESDVPTAQAFAATLREVGARVFVNLSSRSLGDQVKDAVKRGIALFVAYGSEEARTQNLRVKTLSSNEEAVLSTQELLAKLSGK